MQYESNGISQYTEVNFAIALVFKHYLLAAARRCSASILTAKTLLFIALVPNILFLFLPGLARNWC